MLSVHSCPPGGRHSELNVYSLNSRSYSTLPMTGPESCRYPWLLTGGALRDAVCTTHSSWHSRATHSDVTYHGIIAPWLVASKPGSLANHLCPCVLHYHLLNHNSHWRLCPLLRLSRHSATESQAMLKRVAHSQTKSVAQSDKEYRTVRQS